MLRKYTSFFDSTLEHLQEKTQPFETACALEQKLIHLIREISVGLFARYSQEQAHEDLMHHLEECFDWQDGLTDEDARAFRSACEKVHRLESLFIFPWDDDTDGPVRYRRMYLQVSFFEKATKDSFYRMIFTVTEDGEEILDLDIEPSTSETPA